MRSGPPFISCNRVGMKRKTLDYDGVMVSRDASDHFIPARRVDSSRTI